MREAHGAERDRNRAEDHGAESECIRQRRDWAIPAERRLAEDTVHCVREPRRETGQDAGQVQPQAQWIIPPYDERTPRECERNGCRFLPREWLAEEQGREHDHKRRRRVEEDGCRGHGSVADREEVHEEEHRNAHQAECGEEDEIGPAHP